MGSLVGLEMLHRTPAALGRADAKDLGDGAARHFAKYWIVWLGVVLVPEVGIALPHQIKPPAPLASKHTSLVLEMRKLHPKIVTNFLGLAAVVEVHLCNNPLDCLAMVAVHAGLDIFPRHLHDASGPRSDSDIAIDTVLTSVPDICNLAGKTCQCVIYSPPMSLTQKNI